MATHKIHRPTGLVLYQFQALEEFNLMIPQDGKDPVEQPYKPGNIYNVREGNDWLHQQISGSGGLIEQGKARRL